MDTAKWAVIGDRSFYGYSFARYLHRHGHQVLGYSRPKYDILRSQDALLEALERDRPDYVVNFVALNMVAESWRWWRDYYHTNLLGVCGLAAQLEGAGWMRKFVQVSTPEVYGNAGGYLKPGMDYRPSTPYAVSRAAADMHLEAMYRARGFPVVFTRTVNVYGPMQQPYRIVPRTALACALGAKVTLDGGGLSRRSFIHVNDAAEAVQLVAERGQHGQTYHVATRQLTPIYRLVEMVCDLAGKAFNQVVQPGPERPGKDHEYLLDDSSTRQLGWEDKTSLADGLASTVRWYLKHAEEYRGQDLGYTHRP